MLVIGNKWRYITSVFFFSHWYEINQEWVIKQNHPCLSKDNSWMDIHEGFQVGLYVLRGLVPLPKTETMFTLDMFKFNNILHPQTSSFNTHDIL